MRCRHGMDLAVLMVSRAITWRDTERTTQARAEGQRVEEGGWAATNRLGRGRRRRSMIKEHGVALRKLLRADEPRGPTLQEEKEAAVARLSELEAERVTLAGDLARARDAHRHAAARLKTKNRAVTDARKDERKKAAGISKAARQRMKKEAKAARLKMAVAAAERAERAVEDSVVKLRKYQA